uniref:Uncharacterized protein n=1 Tax=Staphylothermus marinus TaxID=2280 RepID=A0A7C4D827_STAMA
MAYTWEPRWESYRVNCYGVVIHTCRDKITKILACPICINALNTCLNSSNKLISIGEKKNVFFFTEEDLIIHIREYHAMRFLRKSSTREEE